MATYIILVNYTDQGIRDVKDAPNRLDAAKALAQDLESDPSFRDLAQERWGTWFRVKQYSVGVDPTGETIGLAVETEPAVAIDLGFLPDDIDPLVRLLREAKATAAERRQAKMH